MVSHAPSHLNSPQSSRDCQWTTSGELIDNSNRDHLPIGRTARTTLRYDRQDRTIDFSDTTPDSKWAAIGKDHSSRMEYLDDLDLQARYETCNTINLRRRDPSMTSALAG